MRTSAAVSPISVLLSVLLALLLGLGAASAHADEPATCTLAGRALEQGNREPLAALHISVRVNGTEIAATTTSEEGEFELTGLPCTTLLLQVRGQPIRPAELREDLRAGRLQVVYYLARKAERFATVVRAQPPRREVIATTLTGADVRRIAGNQNDPIKAVQNLPGVARAPFGIGQIIVWGSAPTDTRAYADGVAIPRVYHFGGLRSTISAEFVSELNFRPGGYGADYGRGLGGVIEVVTRPPKSDRWHGSVTLDLIDGAVTVEGPITKKLHVAAAARLSWISAFLPLFNKSKTQLSPFYWDYQLALRYQLSSRDELDLLIFGATSDISARVEDPDPNSRVDIYSKSYFGRARLRYTRRISKDTKLWLQPSFGGDTFTLDTGDPGLGGSPVRLTVRQLGYNLRGELKQSILSTPSLGIDYALGLDFEGSYAQVETLAPVGPTGGDGQGIPVGGGDTVRDAGLSESGFLGGNFFTDGAGASFREVLNYHLISASPYLVSNFWFADGRVQISPQLRVSIDRLELAPQAGSAIATAAAAPPPRTLFYPEPRILIRAALLPERLWLVGGLGLYHQAPQGSELSPRFGNPSLLWQLSTTYILGGELSLGRGLRVETQGFYKDLRGLVVADPRLYYSNDGLGRAYGAQILIRQPLWHGFSGWIAYTLSRSERREGPDSPWRLFRFDQTHILTIVGSYDLPWGMSASLRFRFASGNPTTQIVGGLRDLTYQNYSAVPGDELAYRLPDFHQLDLRVDKTFTLNRFRIGLYLEVLNVYNRANAENLVYGGRQLYQEGRITSLPVFPNLGVRADF
ncbi:MAG TPA: TonB-dependent receptor plug domain-containing protein [Pseudomonadota bacterium]|nr:TonB-dependent receptor plug domain-containing protein [Pseudomonadota bacterium]